MALSSALANGFRGTCAIVLSRILAVPPNHSSSVFIMGVFTGGPGQRQFSLTRAQVQGRGSSSGHQPGVRRTVSYSDNVALPSLAHSECRVTYDVEPPQHAAALTQALDPLLLGYHSRGITRYSIPPSLCQAAPTAAVALPSSDAATSQISQLLEKYHPTAGYRCLDTATRQFTSTSQSDARRCAGYERRFTLQACFHWAPFLSQSWPIWLYPP